MLRKLLIASAAAALMGVQAFPVSAAPSATGTEAKAVAKKKNQATIGNWGFDLAGMDLAVKPGDDFHLYASGNWIKNTPIPADLGSYGAFVSLRDESDARVRAIVEELARTGGAPGSNSQKIGDFYNSFNDLSGIEAKGLAPLKADLDQIAAAKSHEDIARLMGSPELAVTGPVSGFVGLDPKNPDRYVLSVSQSGLGLPDRDLYLKDDARSVKLRTGYIGYIAQILTLAGIADPASRAGEIFAFETEIAKLQWDRVKNRDRDATYNLKTLAELEKLAPEFPWAASFAAGGLTGISEVVVRQPEPVAALAKLFRATPADTLRSYLSFHHISNSAAVLPRAFDDANFSFYGKLLGGRPEQRDRWKRGVANLSGALGEAVGEIYVARHFPPEHKAQMLELVENVRKAYAARINKLTWMSADTKKVALEKLKAFRPKIAYPDRWRDYSALNVVAGDAYGNQKRAGVFNWNRTVKRINDKTDRDEWAMTPQTVNAYYNPQFNEIVFPSAILQAPFFDPYADPAVNYGGIGGVIGHEMGHGFDDQGAKSDAKGVLRSWWKKEDEEAFKALTASLADQYSGYEALPMLTLNGKLGLGENIGDNGGLSVAYEAYKMSLKGKKAKVIDGFTGDQRFFLGWAQVWRTKWREDALRNQVQTGPHSPGEFRVRGVVRNLDVWYDAFGVKEGEDLYLPPEKRVKIW